VPEHVCECPAGPTGGPARRSDCADDVLELVASLPGSPRSVGSGATQELRDGLAFLGGRSSDQFVKLGIEVGCSA
jgi:hypothetical protein